MLALKGTFPALLTPYNNDKSINEKEFQRLCEWTLFKGLDGLFCNGSAGDSQALSLEKQIRLLELSTEVARAKKAPVIAGITSTIYENTDILMQEAYKCKADALLLVMPYYYKFDEDTLFTYTSNLAKKAKLPLYIYNIPLFAPALSLKFIERVSRLDNIKGIKDSSGDALLLNHILDVVPSDFAVFVGREEFYAGGLFAGASGSMTSMGGIFPELMSGIYHSMQEKNYDRALLIQKSLLKAIRFGMSMAFPLGFALLLKARGFDFANASIHPLSQATKEELDKRFSEAKELIKSIEKQTGISL